MPERDDNRTLGGGLPWAFVLDPAANAAAISEVQRRGLDAARRLIDGIVAQSDRSADHESDVPRGQGGPPDGSTRDEPLAELIRCWAQLTTEVLGKLTEDRSQPRPTGTGTAPNTVSVDVSDRFGSESSPWTPIGGAGSWLRPRSGSTIRRPSRSGPLPSMRTICIHLTAGRSPEPGSSSTRR